MLTLDEQNGPPSVLSHDDAAKQLREILANPHPAQPRPWNRDELYERSDLITDAV